MERDRVLWEKRMMGSVAVYNQGYLWFFNDQQNVLMKLNLQNWGIEVVYGLKGYEPSVDSATDRLILDENTIYKLEIAGKRILVCNLEDKACRYVEIGCYYQDWGNFAGFAKYEDYIYIFPRFLRDITKVSTSNWEVFKVKQPYLYDYDIGNEEEVFFCSVQRDHDMWLFSRSKRIVIQYDMRDDSICLKYLPEEIQFCIDVVTEKNDFYILDTNNVVFKWNVESNSVDLQWENSNLYQLDMKFGKLLVTKNKFVVMPSLGADILIIDRKTKEMIVNKAYPCDFQYLASPKWTKYISYCEDCEYFYFPMRSANYILTINKETGSLAWHKPHFLDKEKYAAYLDYEQKVIIEKKWEIEEFLNYIKKNNCEDAN